MSVQREEERQHRADAVRLIVTRRERAPRSPRMARALKRLIWRYLSPEEVAVASEAADASEAAEAPGSADSVEVTDASKIAGTPDVPDVTQAQDR
jgi:hypothetical protein